LEPISAFQEAGRSPVGRDLGPFISPSEFFFSQRLETRVLLDVFRVGQASPLPVPSFPPPPRRLSPFFLSGRQDPSPGSFELEESRAFYAAIRVFP